MFHENFFSIPLYLKTGRYVETLYIFLGTVFLDEHTTSLLRVTTVLSGILIWREVFFKISLYLISSENCQSWGTLWILPSVVRPDAGLLLGRPMAVIICSAILSSLGKVDIRYWQTLVL
jgi:hypothetical protein